MKKNAFGCTSIGNAQEVSRLRIGRRHIPRMMPEDLIPQGFCINMGINFGRADIFMTEHRLYGPQIGSALQQGRGKRMAQRVGRDLLANACIASGA